MNLNKGKFIFVIFVIILLLTGCSGSNSDSNTESSTEPALNAGPVSFTMPPRFSSFFADSSEKLINELYTAHNESADYEDYRLKVEGVISDVNLKRICITVTALTDKAKKDFEATCPAPILIGGSEDSLMPSHLSSEDRYTKLFYYDYEHLDKECLAFLPKDADTTGDTFDHLGFLSSKSELALTLEAQGMQPEKAIDTALKQTFEEKIGREYVCFSIANKVNDVITININHDNLTGSIFLNQLTMTRTSLSLSGEGLHINVEPDDKSKTILLTSDEASPTIIAEFADGSQIPILNEHMKYTMADQVPIGGAFTMNKALNKPVDVENIIKLNIDGIEYQVK